MAVRLKNRWLLSIAVVVLAILAAWGVYGFSTRRSRGQGLQWVLMFTSTDSATKKRAIDELKAMGNPAVVRLIDMLDEEDSAVRVLVMRQIQHMPTSVRNYLLRHMSTLPASSIRMYTASVLGEMGPAASNAIPALARHMEVDPSPEVVWAAAQALGRIGSNAIPVLVDKLHSPKNLTRHAAAFALGCMREQAAPAIPALKGALADSYEPARISAAYSIYAASPPLGMGLLDVVVSNTGLARITAARAMAQFGISVRMAHPALALMAGSGSPEERLAAVEVLPRMQPWTSAGMSAFLLAFDDDSSGVRRSVTNSLMSGLASVNTLGGLSLVLKRGSPPVQKRALHFLVQAGTNALPFVPSVKILLTNSDETVRSAAVEALGMMTNCGSVLK